MNPNKPTMEVGQSLQEVQALNELALAISSTTDIDAIINTIIDTATDLTKATQGSILLTSEQTDNRFKTLIRVGQNKHESLVQKMCMVIAGWMLKHRVPLLANDILIDDRFKGLELLGYPLKSVLAVPIRTPAEILGVLILHSKAEEKNFTENELRLLNIIASQAAPVLQNASLLNKLKEENLHLKREVEKKYSFEEIIGQSTAIEKVFKLMEKVIPTDVRVLIHGESGTGKELIARAIHYNGPRKDRRFVAIDCGALPENLLESELFGHVKGAFTGAMDTKKGLFQVADGGTLFLDEVNNTSSAMQAKLLRAIQEGEIRPVGGTTTVKINVRVLCASSEDLAEAVENGSFRQDLFFRLKVITIKLPPLRERREDIVRLADYFLGKYAKQLNKRIRGFTREAIECLEHYSWPGNVRELEHAIERGVVLSEPDAETIDADLLPEEVIGSQQKFEIPMKSDNINLLTAVEQLERQMVTEALREHQGNRTKAAERLGLSRRGLLNKIERYGLEE
ncbi:MAG: sigma 54-interacting transcriptional regulator [bacterium]